MRPKSDPACLEKNQDTRGSLADFSSMVAPLWQIQREQRPEFLDRNVSCETVIVGGGISGLSTAWQLSKRGHEVVVVDAGLIGQGVTGWCAGILSRSTTVDLRLIENAFGQEKAAYVLAELSAVLQETQAAFQNVDWQYGKSLYVAANRRHRKVLGSELASRRDFKLETQLLEGAQLGDAWRGFEAGLLTPEEHAVHPVKLLHAMKNAVRDAGGRIYEHSFVDSWQGEPGRFVIRSNGYEVRSKNLILTGGLNWPGLSDLTWLRRLMVPVTGHILVTEPSEAVRNLLNDHCVIALWDTLNLYHYVRYLSDGRVLVGGEEAPRPVPGTWLGPTDPRIRKLHGWAARHHAFPLPPVQSAWRATLLLPVDGLPATIVRSSGQGSLISLTTDGLPFGMLLGKATAEQVLGKPTELLSMFGCQRQLPFPERMLDWVPNYKPLRSLVLQAVFAAMKLHDAWSEAS